MKPMDHDLVPLTNDAWRRCEIGDVVTRRRILGALSRAYAFAHCEGLISAAKARIALELVAIEFDVPVEYPLSEFGIASLYFSNQLDDVRKLYDGFEANLREILDERYEKGGPA